MSMGGLRVLAGGGCAELALPASGGCDLRGERPGVETGREPAAQRRLRRPGGGLAPESDHISETALLGR